MAKTLLTRDDVKNLKPGDEFFERGTSRTVTRNTGESVRWAQGDGSAVTADYEDLVENPDFWLPED